MTYNERKNLITSNFQAIFGNDPTTWVQAPGRVDLMGSHTDYNLGYVMTMTFDKGTWIAARRSEDRLVKIFSSNTASGSEFDLSHIEHDSGCSWTNYVRGIASALQEAGYDLPGFKGLVHSTIPFASGLSSSAALEMAAMMVFKILGNLDISPLKMALMG